MKYLKIVQYFYIAFAAFFAFDAYTKYTNKESYILSIIIAAVSLGMFFFRRHFYNKYQNKK